MASSGPLLTIVTPVLNRRDMLSEAIGSLGSFGPTRIEHIVVDGGSTDGTQELVRSQTRSTLIVAAGTGIYEAMNVGIRAARGSFIGFLNSDDFYVPGALDAVRLALEREPEIELLTGGAELYSPDTGTVVPIGAETESSLRPLALVRRAVNINSRFFAASLFERLGLFDTAFPVAADRDFLITVAMASPRHRRLDDVLYRYRQHDGSLTWRPTSEVRLRIAREHLTIFARALSSGKMPESWRSEFLTAIAIESVRVARLDPTRALPVLKGAAAQDPAFLLRFVTAGLRAAPRRTAQALARH